MRRPPQKNIASQSNDVRRAITAVILSTNRRKALGPSTAYTWEIFGPTRFWIPVSAGLATDTTPRQAAQTAVDATPWKAAKSHGYRLMLIAQTKPLAKTHFPKTQFFLRSARDSLNRG